MRGGGCRSLALHPRLDRRFQLFPRGMRVAAFVDGGARSIVAKMDIGIDGGLLTSGRAFISRLPARV